MVILTAFKYLLMFVKASISLALGMSFFFVSLVAAAPTILVDLHVSLLFILVIFSILIWSFLLNYALFLKYPEGVLVNLKTFIFQNGISFWITFIRTLLCVVRVLTAPTALNFYYLVLALGFLNFFSFKNETYCQPTQPFCGIANPDQHLSSFCNLDQESVPDLFSRRFSSLINFSIQSLDLSNYTLVDGEPVFVPLGNQIVPAGHPDFISVYTQLDTLHDCVRQTVWPGSGTRPDLAQSWLAPVNFNAHERYVHGIYYTLGSFEPLFEAFVQNPQISEYQAANPGLSRPLFKNLCLYYTDKLYFNHSLPFEEKDWFVKTLIMRGDEEIPGDDYSHYTPRDLRVLTRSYFNDLSEIADLDYLR